MRIDKFEVSQGIENQITNGSLNSYRMKMELVFFLSAPRTQNKKMDSAVTSCSELVLTKATNTSISPFLHPVW